MPGRPAHPSWRELARRHWPHYCACLLLLLGLAASDTIPPRQHAVYSASDRQWWTYTRPRLPEKLPDVDMPLLAVALPLAVIWALAPSRLEAHHMSLALLACIGTSGLVTNLVKTQVARPRPDFATRCWRRTPVPTFSGQPSGLPVCDAKAIDSKLRKGLRSFPSGHSSWAGAGLGFFSLWLIGWLQCFSSGGRAQPLQLMLGLLPLGGALAVGCQRFIADKHHVEDIAAGLAIGLSTAALFYLQARASLQPQPPDERGSHAADAAPAAAAGDLEG